MKRKSSGAEKAPHKKRLLITALAALIGIGAVGGIVGTSAFFTDQASISTTTNAGTLKMTSIDQSDLDGNYAQINATGAEEDGETTYPYDYKLANSGYQGASFALPEAYDKENPSTDIINPGDSGILAYTINNAGEKSFDTAKVVNTIVKLPEGQWINWSADRTAYTIDGLGEPEVRWGYAYKNDNNELVYEANNSGRDGETAAILLIYAQADDKPVSGSVETEKDGENALPTSAAYAYRTQLDRLVKNKFMDADVYIKTTVYAKQHRNALAGSTINHEVDDYDDDKFTLTGDWVGIGSFEQTTDPNGISDAVINAESEMGGMDATHPVDPEPFED